MPDPKTGIDSEGPAFIALTAHYYFEIYPDLRARPLHVYETGFAAPNML